MAGGRLPGVSLLLALPALVIYCLPALAARLELDWRAVSGGEVWRIVTGHWTHVSLDHLLWDVAAFAILATACELRESCGRRRTLMTVGLAAVAIPITLWLALPGMIRYRGLSGIDSALFVLLAVTILKEELAAGRRGRVWVGALALAAFGAKLGFEAITGTALFTEASGGAVPVPLAHLVGGLCGLAIAAMPYTPRRSPGPSR
ncbi:MAG TPA: rhombosortase [Thermoanaerobaculia bacterium]|nr:rhombosortase [Thermoanaerobaculia bacterium]